MHDIWNPWHGCYKKSEGCLHCYMYFLDAERGHDGSKIYKTKNGFSYPLQKDREGNYKVKSGEMIRVCMTSDFFLKEADPWREEAWKMMKIRSDVKFYLLTKRPERVQACLPSDWGQGYENVMLNVSAENQKRADERIPFLLALPFHHKGVMCAPLIGSVSLEKYLATGQIEQVYADGENYDGARVCRYEWVKTLSEECKKAHVTFVFCSTGRRFEKDGRVYAIENSALRSLQAYKSGLSYQGKPLRFHLKDEKGMPLSEEELYHPHFRKRCLTCSLRLTCNGCQDCGRCLKSDNPIVKIPKY